MAKCNEINVGRFNRALQKSLQLKGGPPSAQLASEVMPILAFFRGAEDRSLESWYRFASWAQCVATVAAHGVAQLRNPKTSGAIVVVERISFNNQTNRSEEHTSELQSHLNLVCRLLLEKKKIKDI